MSKRKHRSDYIILIVFGAVLVGTVVLLVSYGWFQDTERRRNWQRTTHSTGRQGLMAFYLLCDHLGYDVSRVDRPLLDDTLDGIDVLVVIDPVIEVNPGECAALRRWMEAGGVLVCAGGEPTLPRQVHRIGDPWGSRASYDRWGFTVHARRRPVDAGRDARPLAADVAHTHLLTDETIDLGAGGESEPARVLLEDSAGVRVATRSFGLGRAVRAADCSFLFNRTLGKADNAVLAVNLMAYAVEQSGGGRIAFDEYHTGYGRQETGWSLLGTSLLTTPPGWAMLALTAAGILYLVYAGRRFGTRRPPPEPRRRSKLEYVESVGATYRAVGARGLTLRLLYAWLRRRAAQQAGLEASASSDVIARGLAPQSPDRARRYAETFAACEEALQAPHLPDRRFAALLANLTRIETETLHGRQRGE